MGATLQRLTYPILYKQYEVSALNTLSLGFIIYVKIKKKLRVFLFSLLLLDNYQ